jgi:hypothetical protein
MLILGLFVHKGEYSGQKYSGTLAGFTEKDRLWISACCLSEIFATTVIQ